MRNKTLYQKFAILKDEIYRHKWLESEKANKDIGFEQALTDWMEKHGTGWRTHYIKKN